MKPCSLFFSQFIQPFIGFFFRLLFQRFFFFLLFCFQLFLFFFHFILAELLAFDEYPKRIDAKTLFYAEATKLVQYIFLNYGRATFLDFINIYLFEYNKLAQQKKTLSKKDGREIFKKALKQSSLNKEFAGYSSFEENWLKSIYQKD